jgi:hypothetical protein
MEENNTITTQTSDSIIFMKYPQMNSRSVVAVVVVIMMSNDVVVSVVVVAVVVTVVKEL